MNNQNKPKKVISQNKIKQWFLLFLSFMYYYFSRIHKKIFLRPHSSYKTKMFVIGSLKVGGGFRSALCLKIAQILQNSAIIKKNKACILTYNYHKLAFNKSPKPFIKSNLIQITKKNISKFQFSDETLMLYQNSKMPIFTTNNRLKAWKILSEKHNFDLIISDGGIEDHRLAKAENILIEEKEKPFSIKDIIPYGQFRSFAKNHPNIKHHWFLDPNSKQNGFLIQKPEIKNINGDYYSLNNATLISGIGNPRRLISELKKYKITFENSIIRPNHDNNFNEFINDFLNNNSTPVLMTLKDYARLDCTIKKNLSIFVIHQNIKFNLNLECFFFNLCQYSTK